MFASLCVSLGGRSAPLVSGRTSFDRHFLVFWSAMLFAAWTTSAQPILPTGQHLCSPEFNKTEVMESTSPPCVNVLIFLGNRNMSASPPAASSHITKQCGMADASEPVLLLQAVCSKTRQVGSAPIRSTIPARRKRSGPAAKHVTSRLARCAC